MTWNHKGRVIEAISTMGREREAALLRAEEVIAAHRIKGDRYTLGALAYGMVAALVDRRERGSGMKMGEVRVRPDGGFVITTPEGVREVTLRCREDGVVCVEEVVNGGLSVRALSITQIARHESSAADQAAIARAAKAAQSSREQQS